MGIDVTGFIDLNIDFLGFQLLSSWVDKNMLFACIYAQNRVLTVYGIMSFVVYYRIVAMSVSLLWIKDKWALDMTQMVTLMGGVWLILTLIGRLGVPWWMEDQHFWARKIVEGWLKSVEDEDETDWDMEMV